MLVFQPYTAEWTTRHLPFSGAAETAAGSAGQLCRGNNGCYPGRKLSRPGRARAGRNGGLWVHPIKLIVGTNLVSFARSKTERGTEYRIDSRESGWTFILTGDAVQGGRAYLNGKPVSLTGEGVLMTGTVNRVLVEPR